MKIHLLYSPGGCIKAWAGVEAKSNLSGGRIRSSRIAFPRYLMDNPIRSPSPFRLKMTPAQGTIPTQGSGNERLFPVLLEIMSAIADQNLDNLLQTITQGASSVVEADRATL